MYGNNQNPHDYNRQPQYPVQPQGYAPPAPQPFPQAGTYYGDGYAVDAQPAEVGDLSHPAVAAFVRRVYTYFGTALAFAAVTAFGGTLAVEHFVSVGNTGAVTGIWVGGLVAFFVSYFVVVFTRKSHSPLKTGLLYVFAGAAGLMLAPMLMRYVASGLGMQIVFAFGIATVTFFGLTVYTFTTGKDFRGLGSYLMVGILVLIGMFIMSWIVPFSSFLHMGLMGLGLLVFIGFTLFDTSRVVRDYYVANDAVSAAINLLYDFVMLFRYALYFLGVSRD